ncbi:hypothetical protein [Burkholderia vietnamiensis]|uniref:hypothetical protein n=1 Tax=Burkholderia vietnamiensis TaxID=60552 RepID=UPI000A642272|nr:hypothetical protein [Burkholderia vietnamiensis]
MALRDGNAIIDTGLRFGSADHGTNWANTMRLAERLGVTEPFEPFFNSALAEDPNIRQAREFEHSRAYGAHLRASVEQGIWRLSATEGGFGATVTPLSWRSALHLLTIKFDFLTSSAEERQILGGLRGPFDGEDGLRSVVRLTLASGLRSLEPLTVGVSYYWDSFLSAVGVSGDGISQFISFCSWLNQSHIPPWLTRDELNELFKAFQGDLGLPELVVPGEFETFIDATSVSLHEAVSWGIPSPFLRFGKHFYRWPFVFHVMHPNLTLLALLMKRYSPEWDRTVGSGAAHIAKYLVRKLKTSGEIFVATCKVKKGVGDLDIAIYNASTGDFLLCEVKTVFDRFRTNRQIANFTNQRVNYQKAVGQLRASAREIESGRWSLKEIFPSGPSGKPARILPVVLTWWDIFDPFQGTADCDIAVSNFRIFEGLLETANGDVDALHQALLGLSAVRCPAGLRRVHIPVDHDASVTLELESQTDVLPPPDSPSRAALNSLAASAISDIASFPEDWREQMIGKGEDPKQYRI